MYSTRLRCSCQEAAGKSETRQRGATTRIACNASARKPLGRINLVSAVHVFELLAMHPPGSRWTEIRLASVKYVLDLIAMHLPGSRWRELKLASAEQLLESFAMPLPGSR